MTKFYDLETVTGEMNSQIMECVRGSEGFIGVCDFTEVDGSKSILISTCDDDFDCAWNVGLTKEQAKALALLILEKARELP